MPFTLTNFLIANTPNRSTHPLQFLVKRFLSSLITGWIPSLINAIWFGMLVPLVSYLCIQVWMGEEGLYY